VPTSATSSTRPNLRKTLSQRLPPPSLFQGPPSRNASHISLALPTAPPSELHAQSQPRASRIPPASSFAGPLPLTSGGRLSTAFNTSPRTQRAGVGANNADRADALWAEMQNTLAEVELSAMNSSHVFGASHAKALEDLRTSQLSLAQAWAKSEADEMGDAKNDLNFSTGAEVSIGPSLGSPKSQQSKKDDKEKDAKRDLEEETERDIHLARKRREANDRYFQQVNNGVLDVVGKLEEVAAAMRRVERESREIWSESDSGGASATDATDTDATDIKSSPG
jgi:hypothetical protein